MKKECLPPWELERINRIMAFFLQNEAPPTHSAEIHIYMGDSPAPLVVRATLQDVKDPKNPEGTEILKAAEVERDDL